MSKKKITEHQKSEREIQNIRFSDTYYKIIESKTKLEILEYLTELGIIHNACTCICGVSMGLYNKSKVGDGYIWVCKVCRKEKNMQI